MYYAISDIHGCDKLLREALTKIDLCDAQNKIVFLGDYIDRGPDSCQVLQRLYQLQKSYPEQISVLRGNHEELFLRYLKNGEGLAVWGDWNGNTVKSFLRGTRYEKRVIFHSYFYDRETQHPVDQEIRSFILHNYKELIRWLENLPCFYETEDQIFVHAGIDLTLKDWKETPESQILWQPPDLKRVNQTGKSLVVGHTVTRKLNPDKSDRIYVHQIAGVSPIYFIDGAAVASGKLNIWQEHS